MRKRGGLYQRLPSAVGKPTAARESSGYLRSGRTRVRFKHRPYARVCIIGRYLWSLLDPGFEISFINPTTAELARRRGNRLSRIDMHASLANGTAVAITRTATLPITAGRRTVEHEFQVIPNLDCPVLIGVDLWARLRIHLPLPPVTASPAHTNVGEISRDLHPRTSGEDQRLQDFLTRELAPSRIYEDRPTAQWGQIPKSWPKVEK